MQKYKVPKGMLDYPPDACYVKNAVEEKILGVFKSNGYERVETPGIEYHNVFSYNDVFPLEGAFKMSDTDGSLIILRPDMTMPLARLVSTKMNPVLPLKLCYIGNSFSLLEREARYREFTQAGLELIGEGSYLADAEAVILAVESLKAAGLDDFLIELGNTEFFRGLIEECGLGKREEEELIKNVDKKNNYSITETLKKAGASKELTAAAAEFPTLFGEGAIKRAFGLTANKRSGRALDELEKLFGLLTALGYEKYVSVDLGLMNSMNFYTGTVFQGISRYFGAAILSGGRYDKLYTLQGSSQNIPATGFAIGIKNLLTALERSGKTYKKPVIDYVIGGHKRLAGKAFERAAELTRAGYTASCTFITDEKKLKEYAENAGAKNIIFIDK
ncbi:MAG: ATP phosphoribosyltransferase regulatory subunit [Clostridiales bacterium]|jgi:ATP phosphoribosyltransferase regulatory subunit|nr:ATP phosphoribosyltransferase regulatory subunit [Clostridiales bacterium]